MHGHAAEQPDLACAMHPLQRHASCTLEGNPRESVLKRPAYLITRLDASSVSGPALNRCQHDKLPAGGVCSNEQAHALDLPIGAHSEIGILPTNEDTT
jgi:hypothetical protein